MLILEIYVYSGLKTLLTGSRLVKLLPILYIAQFLFVLYALFNLWKGMQTGQIVRNATINFWLGVVMTSFITKLVYSVFLLVHDGGRLMIGASNYLSSLFTGETKSNYIPERRQFLNNLSIAIAAIPFASLLYGMTKGKYNYTVKKIKLTFKDLPKAFDSFKIVQISDIHSGSFDDIDEVVRGIDMINEQKPDLFLFTGDLINSEKDEIDPYMHLFEKIKATHGKYAVLGNHDYYGFYRSGEDRSGHYWNDFMSKFNRMGIKLLNNEHTRISIEEDKIVLVGVENWGAGRYFPKHGDLEAALKGVSKNDFTILMSHDPTHWDHHVLPNEKNIHLTLSGHTHGMQFGIDIPGFKWSPVKYRYPRWSGLYTEQDQHLYVNKGFGFLAFPGRVGMWPEITVIELRKG
jgi:hypothetical protein